MGTRYVWISGFLLLASVVAWFSAIKAFELSKLQESKMGQIFTAVWIVNLIFSGSIVYMTRDVKKRQCSYWMNRWLSYNQKSFFYDSFIRTYKTASEQEYFIQQRTLEVHDMSICVSLISVLMYIIFIVNYDKISEVISESDTSTTSAKNCNELGIEIISKDET